MKLVTKKLEKPTVFNFLYTFSFHSKIYPDGYSRVNDGASPTMEWNLTVGASPIRGNLSFDKFSLAMKQ